MYRWLLGVLMMATLSAAAQAGPTLYVAPNGSDRWSGRLPAPNAAKTDGPFATLPRAQQEVRAIKARLGELDGPITVSLRGGFYPLADTLTFTSADSGSERSPIVYSATQGEKPVVSGGRRITGWQKGEGELWTVKIPEVAASRWYFHQLFVNGERRTRARIPNEGYLRTDGPLAPYNHNDAARRDPATKIGFRFKEGDIKEWPNLDDVNVVVYHSWTASWHHIAQVDTQARTVRFTAPSGWPIGWWENNQRYVVENCREALDSPGEWYLDRKTGILTYWPMPGEQMGTAEVVAPALQTLVRFDGANGVVQHIRLEGLSFQHADWEIARDKPADGQAATFLGAAVMATGARNCSLEKCEIAHVGEHALWLGRGCRDDRVVQCHLHDIGAGGVYIGEAGRGQQPPDPARAGHNLVQNCFIHDGGHVFPAGIGVWVGQSADNTISHNEVCDFFYSGMSLGWTWGYGPSEAHGNVVEFNHIHDFGKGVLSDMGGVYTLGIQPGTVVRNNVIHDVLSYSYGGWGLYTDEGSSNIVMENNLVYRTKSGGFHQHYGKENIIRNNIFATASEGEIIRTRQEEHLSFDFNHNIVYQTIGPLLGSNWSNHQFRMDYNDYWHTAGLNELDGMELDEWQQKSGQDKNSIVADPGFRDPAHGDYSLKPDSPALKLGFKPIDVSTVGLVGDPAWVALPKQIRRPALVLPGAKVAQKVDDGFEETPVGQPPAGCEVRQSGQASVSVTDETAATGRRSLKFSDDASAERLWEPHIFYTPAFLAGKVRVSYDLRAEAGAIAWMECRDAANPYNAGPSLRVEGGKLFAGQQQLMAVPVGQWVHYEVTVALGKASTGTYDLAVTLPGGDVKRFELPLARAAFRRLQWLGFMSMADAKTVFYLDNVRVEKEQ